MSDLQQTLHELHESLSRSQTLSLEDRRQLEMVLQDIQGALSRNGETVPQAEHGHRLESAAVRLEAGHPSLAAAIRGVLDALAKAGI